MKDTEWTPEALDAHWGTSRGYACRLLNGEKPWSVERMLALPDDLEARLEHLRAESFGRIVVEPMCGPEAVAYFVGSLVGLLTHGLPVKADRMARMNLPTIAKAAGQ